MPSAFARNAIVLGLLTAIGPFAIDMYLPALPAISAHLEASTAATQATLMAFFVALGICQIAYGPVSDMVGRKPPLYVGLCLFVLASIGCVFSPTIGWLIAFRFIQGVGASAVMVVPRAIIRDLHTGLEAARLMSLVRAAPLGLRRSLLLTSSKQQFEFFVSSHKVSEAGPVESLETTFYRRRSQRSPSLH
jgi:MFS transporter, DHA1 family, multidrug resistance protein